MKYLPLLGRTLFSIIFLMTIASHFKSETIGYAATQGVPFANILVPLSGLIAFTGGISIISGYRAKAGAFLIVLFLVPVTFYMHAFWKETDPMQIRMQTGNFIKNLSLLGGALLIVYFGPGPISLSKNKPDIV